MKSALTRQEMINGLVPNAMYFEDVAALAERLNMLPDEVPSREVWQATKMQRAQ